MSQDERYPLDRQQLGEPWLFVLQDEAENYIVRQPREIGLNGSFACFKMIMTDVVGFEEFLQSNKDRSAFPQGCATHPPTQLAVAVRIGPNDLLRRHLKHVARQRTSRQYQSCPPTR